MKRILVIAACGLLVAGGIYIWMAIRNTPVVRVRVVDEAGKAIAGATIKPYAIRGSNRTHYGWGTNFSVAPKEVRSNGKGIAAIEYPTYLVERVRSLEVTFTIEHPEYCADTPSVSVPAPLPSTASVMERLRDAWQRISHRGEIEAVTLRAGGVIEASGYLEEGSEPVGMLCANVSTENGEFQPGYWRREGTQLVTRQMPPGHLYLQLAQMGENGTNYFSEVQSLKVEGGETKRLNLPLRAGIRIRGKLDETVPRPVRNGFVNVRTVYDGKEPTRPLAWADYAEVKADGSFELKGAPPGRIQMIVLCDGFVSKNPGSAGSHFVEPQVFDLTGAAEVILEMEPTAIAAVRVLDNEERPLANARVGFSPNQRWAWSWSSMLGTAFSRTSELLQERSEGASWKRVRRIRDFSGMTDSNGVARIGELKASEQTFSVSHEQYEMAISENKRSHRMKLEAGPTNYATVKLQKKGRQVLE